MPAAINPDTRERFEGLSPDLVDYYLGQGFEIEYDADESARFPILNPGTPDAVVATPDGDEPIDVPAATVEGTGDPVVTEVVTSDDTGQPAEVVTTRDTTVTVGDDGIPVLSNESTRNPGPRPGR